MPMRRIAVRAVILVVLLLLVPACDGGGGGGEGLVPFGPPAAPPSETGTAGGEHAGTIHVTVLDRRLGRPIGGATVSLGNDGVSFVTTDVNGEATFTGLVAGSPATLTAAAAGYETLTFGNTRALHVTFSLNPYSWTLPEYYVTVTGLTLGTAGGRGYVRCDLAHRQTDSSLIVPDTTTDADSVRFVCRANRYGLVAATQTTGGGNFVMKSVSRMSSATQSLDVLTFPYPAAVPVILTNGTASLPASLGSPSTERVAMNLFSGGAGPVDTGDCTFESMVNWRHTLTYYPAWGVDLYQVEASFTGTLGRGSAFLNAPTAPSSLSHLAVPGIPAPATPAPGATGLGKSPTLGWNPVAAASLYTVTMTWTDGGAARRWQLLVVDGSSTIVVPTLPAAVASQGLTTANTVAWDVQASIIAGFDPDNMTEYSNLRKRTGESASTVQPTFTP